MPNNNIGSNVMSAILPESPEFGLAFCVFGRAESILLARGGGFDFVVVDMEHGPLGLSDLGQVAAAGCAAGMPVLGRVTGPGSPDISRVLDCGATGVIVPHVDTPEQARDIASACRFAPAGTRALPGPLPLLDYRVLPAATLCGQAESSVQVIAMIESADALNAVRDIAAVPGIDALMIGSNDLADSLGHRGEVSHPEALSAFRCIARAAQENGCLFGIMGLQPSLMQSHAYDLGARMIVATNETNLITNGGADLLSDLRDRFSRK